MSNIHEYYVYDILGFGISGNFYYIQYILRGENLYFTCLLKLNRISFFRLDLILVILSYILK